mgnify:FL=1
MVLISEKYPPYSFNQDICLDFLDDEWDETRLYIRMPALPPAPELQSVCGG